MKHLLLVLLVALVSLAGLTPAHAQPRDREAEARVLFRAGARAYDAGKFDVAVQAFEQAYELSPKPALRFSTAQALRRQYAMTPNPALLQKALTYYKQYIAEVKEGARVRDAAEGIGEIQVLLGQQGEAVPAGTNPAEATPQRKGTLNINSSVPGAVASVDGGAPIEIPTFIELTPGNHRVVVTAKGYQPVTRQVRIDAGRVAAVDPPLVAKAALLTVKADAGAEVLVDGRPVGEAPISRPIELKDGEHRVVVGKNGYKVYAEDLQLRRGQKKTVEADLDMTAQRIAAWVFFGAAVISTAGGIVLTVTAITKQREANTIKVAADAVPRPMTLEEANTYNQAIESRDNLAGLAAASYGLAGLSAGIGLLLFTLDEPALSAAASEDTAMLIVNGRF